MGLHQKMPSGELPIYCINLHRKMPIDNRPYALLHKLLPKQEQKHTSNERRCELGWVGYGKRNYGCYDMMSKMAQLVLTCKAH